MIFFVMLLAIGQPPADADLQGAGGAAIGINLFLAITFDRYMQFSYDDNVLSAWNN